MALNSDNSFEDERPPVIFKQVGGDEDGQEYLRFKYEQPSISVQTSANFAEHDVFGDITVRQKLGEKPDEISVEGVCTDEEANKVDNLIYEEVVELISHRWSGVVHITSTSTNPISDGGGMDMDGRWLYSCTIEAVEITETFNEVTDLEIEQVLNMSDDAHGEFGPIDDVAPDSAESDYGSFSVSGYQDETTADGTTITFSGGITNYDVDGNINCYFKYREKGSDDWDWTTDTYLSSAKGFQIRQSGLGEREEYEWRAVGSPQVAPIPNQTSDIYTTTTGFGESDSDGLEVRSLETNNVNALTAYAGIEVTKFVGVEKATVIFEYRKEGSATWTRNGEEYTIDEETQTFNGEIGPLYPSTVYEWRAIVTVDDAISDYNGNASTKTDIRKFETDSE